MNKAKTMYRGIALVIGINEYDETETITQLDKAVADAKSISEVLTKLGFKVFDKYDIASSEYDSIKDQFIKELSEAKLGIFFFAGHGLECKGENILLTKDTVASTGILDTIKRYAIVLQDLVNEMHRVCESNIIIVDACRQPYVEKFRGGTQASIAPIVAPKGTLIAFSTSCGEMAGEGKKGTPHSNYTTALLKHLDEPNLEVERLFKKVRTTLHSLTNGKQTSWEHTSLIGNFVFNSGKSKDPEISNYYSDDAVADKNWSDSTIATVIDMFKSHNWYNQNDAIGELSGLKNLSDDQLFVIGRNILQSYIGGSHKCDSFIHNIQSILNYNVAGNNHLLNGILFEIYFDSNGQFRGSNLRNDNLNWMVTLIKDGRFTQSFEFINNQLLPFSERLLFIPSNRIQSIEIVVIGKNRSDGIFNYYDITDITVDGNPLLTDDFADTHPSCLFYNKDSIDGLKKTISNIYAIPYDLLKLTFLETPLMDASITLNKSFRII